MNFYFMKSNAKKNAFFLLFLIVSFFYGYQNVLAAKVDFINKNIWLSKDTNVIKDDQITVYSMVVNNDEKHIGGEMRFLDINTNTQLGDIVSFSLPNKGSSQILNVKWVAIPGDHKFQATIINAYEIINGQKKIAEGGGVTSSMTNPIFVDHDADGDGLFGLEEAKLGTDPNNPDTDGDTLKDKTDPNPLKKDADDDGDPDNTDPAPLDKNIKTLLDTDKDGTPDINDSDDDNDGLYDFEEEEGKRSDPLKYDTDLDGVGDKQDAFPRDFKKSIPDAPKTEIKEEIKIQTEKINETIKQEIKIEDEKITPETREKSKQDLKETNVQINSTSNTNTENKNNEQIQIDPKLIEDLDTFFEKTDSSITINSLENNKDGLVPIKNEKIIKKEDSNKTLTSLVIVSGLAIVVVGLGIYAGKNK